MSQQQDIYSSTFSSGDRVKITKQGIHAGVNGRVACVYDDGLIDVEMFDGPDTGSFGHFEPGDLQLL